MAAKAGSMLGLQGASPVQRTVVNRTGGTRVAGDVVVLDELQGDGATTTVIAGETTSTEVNVIAPVTATLGYGRFAYVEGLGALDDAEMQVAFSGRGLVSVDAQAGGANAIAVGDGLIAEATFHPLIVLPAVATNFKIIGIAKAAVASGLAVIDVDFDGLHGWGQQGD